MYEIMQKAACFGLNGETEINLSFLKPGRATFRLRN